MSLPIEALSTTHRELGLVIAVLIGFGFGFVLERAGFGRSTTLAAQFYGHNMTVFKVMFGAIVTALLGLVIASGLGVIDLRALSEQAVSATYIGPMIVGGFALGVGFIVSGYCPGTSLVATSSGNIDGMVALAGIIVGSVLYGEIFPLIDTFHSSGDKGQVFLYDLLGVPPAVLAAAVMAVALGAFLGAEKLEKSFSKKFRAASESLAASVPTKPRRGFAFGVMAIAAAAGLLLLLAPVSSEAQSRSAQTITAHDLAIRVFDEPWNLRILDLRDREACADERVLYSECTPAETLGDLGLAYAPGTRDLVLVGAAELPALPEAAAAYKGRVLLLEGGFAAWKDFALEKPTPPSADATAAERDRYQFRAAVNQALTGSAPPPPPPAAATPYVPPKKKKGGGCG